MTFDVLSRRDFLVVSLLVPSGLSGDSVRRKFFAFGDYRVEVELRGKWVAKASGEVVTIRGIVSGRAEVHWFIMSRTSPGGMMHWWENNAEGPRSEFRSGDGPQAGGPSAWWVRTARAARAAGP